MTSSSKNNVIDLTKNENEFSNNLKSWTNEDDIILFNEVKKKNYKELSNIFKRSTVNIRIRVITEIIYPKCQSYSDIKKYSDEYDISEDLIKRFIINKKLCFNNKLKLIDDKLIELNKKLDKLISSSSKK